MYLALDLVAGRDGVLLFQGLSQGVAIKSLESCDLVGRDPGRDLGAKALLVPPAASIPESPAIFSKLGAPAISVLGEDGGQIRGGSLLECFERGGFEKVLLVQDVIRKRRHPP